MKKLFCSIILAATMVATPLTSFATDANMQDGNIDSINEIEIATTNEVFDSSNVLKELGEIKYDKKIIMDGKSYNLYPEFVDIEGAVENAAEKCKTVLDRMKAECNLGQFNKETATQYQSEYTNFFAKALDGDYGEISDDFIGELCALREFFDIYENTEDNRSLIMIINGVNSAINTSTKNRYFDELLVQMPYDFAEGMRVQGDEQMTYSGNSSFSISKGVEYAKTYAINPNITKYSTCAKGDCSNFASQIKFAGGVPKYKTYGDTDAWNYKVTINSQYPTLAYSARWCNARSFVNFFGYKAIYSAKNYSNKYTTFIKFAENISKGDFIAYDTGGDKSWEHVGFVTAIKNSNGVRESIPYHGSNYKNFKIAQHSSFYHLWVDDDNNHWEELPDAHEKLILARVN